MVRQRIVVCLIPYLVVLGVQCTASSISYSPAMELEPTVSRQADQFGYSVGINSSSIVVGAWATEAVHVFDRRSGTLTGHIDMSQVLPGSRFGFDVAVNERFALIGAPMDLPIPTVNGSAHLIDLATQQPVFTWREQAHIQYGHSVALGKQIAAVGALRGSGNIGRVYVYDLISGEKKWELTGSPLGRDSFGGSVATNDRYVFASAHQDSHSGTHSGALYQFDVATGDLVRKITLEGAKSSDNFGYSVSVDGDNVLVGAPGMQRAFIFNAETGDRILELTTADPWPQANFGHSVALRNGLAVVGTPSGDDNNTFLGSAFVFDASTGAQLARLVPDVATRGDTFGFAVAVDGDTVVVGAPRTWDSIRRPGFVTVFHVPEPSTISMIALVALSLSTADLVRRRSAKLVTY